MTQTEGAESRSGAQDLSRALEQSPVRVGADRGGRRAGRITSRKGPKRP